MLVISPFSTAFDPAIPLGASLLMMCKIFQGENGDAQQATRLREALLASFTEQLSALKIQLLLSGDQSRD